MNGQRINCLGDWIGRGGKDRNRAQETAWEALLSAAPPAARPASREAVASRIPSFGNREGKIPGVPEEPEPGANHACPKFLPLFDIVTLRASPSANCDLADRPV